LLERWREASTSTLKQGFEEALAPQRALWRQGLEIPMRQDLTPVLKRQMAAWRQHLAQELSSQLDEVLQNWQRTASETLRHELKAALGRQISEAAVERQVREAVAAALAAAASGQDERHDLSRPELPRPTRPTIPEDTSVPPPGGEEKQITAPSSWARIGKR